MAIHPLPPLGYHRNGGACLVCKESGGIIWLQTGRNLRECCPVSAGGIPVLCGAWDSLQYAKWFTGHGREAEAIDFELHGACRKDPVFCLHHTGAWLLGRDHL